MMRTNEERLKAELTGWEDSFRIRQEVVNSFKFKRKEFTIGIKKEIKEHMNRIRELKKDIISFNKTFNKTKRALAEAKRNVKLYKNKLSKLPTLKKQWVERNIGNLISRLEDSK